MSIDLAPHLNSGLLRMEAVRTEAASSEEHYMHIKRMITEHLPAVLQSIRFRPLPAWGRTGGPRCRGAADLPLPKQGHHSFFHELARRIDPNLETTTLHVSTISDSWIQIYYALLDGERNRALSIIKSRGSKHSNQLRELIFSDAGIALADTYTAGGAVLMGTLRMEKENAAHMLKGNGQ